MTNATHALLLPNQVDEALAAHFAALGVGTISAYKLWCHRHSLGTALDKTPQERAAELENEDFWRERLEKRRRAGSLYVHLLRESARILRLWSDKVGLVQKGT